MKLYYLVSFLLVLVSCKTEPKIDCCFTKEDLGKEILQAMKSKDLNKFKSHFMPYQWNGLIVSENINISKEEYETKVNESFIESQNEFSDKGYIIDNFEIIEVEREHNSYEMTLYGSQFTIYEFYIILANDQNNFIRAEIDCIDLNGEFKFRDRIRIK